MCIRDRTGAVIRCSLLQAILLLVVLRSELRFACCMAGGDTCAKMLNFHKSCPSGVSKQSSESEKHISLIFILIRCS